MISVPAPATRARRRGDLLGHAIAVVFGIDDEDAHADQVSAACRRRLTGR